MAAAHCLWPFTAEGAEVALADVHQLLPPTVAGACMRLQLHRVVGLAVVLLVTMAAEAAVASPMLTAVLPQQPHSLPPAAGVLLSLQPCMAHTLSATAQPPHVGE
jgi:hypothetical protein